MKGYKKKPFRKQDFFYEVVLERIQKLAVVFPSTQMPPLDGGIKLNSNWVSKTQFERKISEKK